MAEEREKAGFICVKDTLDGGYPALVLGINAARQGMESKIFYSFMGLNLVMEGGAERAVQLDDATRSRGAVEPVHVLRDNTVCNPVALECRDHTMALVGLLLRHPRPSNGTAGPVSPARLD